MSTTNVLSASFYKRFSKKIAAVCSVKVEVTNTRKQTEWAEQTNDEVFKSSNWTQSANAAYI